MPSLYWLAFAFAFAPICAIIMATLVWSGRDENIVWSGDHLLYSTIMVLLVAGLVGGCPLLDLGFDAWDHIIIWTNGTGVGPLAFITWVFVIPHLRRRTAPHNQRQRPFPATQKYFGEINSAD